MSEKMKRGLIVGKFSPLHKGHELLIRAALAQCEQLFIYGYSNPEFSGCEASRRERWLQTLFPTARTRVITAERLAEFPRAAAEFADVPHNDAPAEVHRRFVGLLYLSDQKSPLDAVFTSEEYGDGFAAHLTRMLHSESIQDHPVMHVQVDMKRELVPTSGTAVREDVHGQREFLSPEVYRDFVAKVVLFGGESTGKSCLAQALAEQLGTVCVPEYGRTLWEQKGGQLTVDDMLAIGQEQVVQEERLLLQANRYLICDTSPLTTFFYSKALFGSADPRLRELSFRPYDSILLCNTDCPFVQDGTRQNPQFRERQHEWYVQTFQERGMSYHLINGPLEKRIDRALECLEAKERRVPIPRSAAGAGKPVWVERAVLQPR